MNKLLIAISAALFCTSAGAWEGYDYNHGSYIEIDKGNLVRSGETIEVYDYSSGYKEMEVQSISHSGSGAKVEVYDYSTGEYRTFEMD